LLNSQIQVILGKAFFLANTNSSVESTEESITLVEKRYTHIKEMIGNGLFDFSTWGVIMSVMSVK
jgi:hypothetical protein